MSFYHNKTKSSSGIGFTLFAFCVTVFGLVLWLLSSWTDRNLDFWFSYFKGTPVDIPMWISVIATIVFNGPGIIINLIAEILKYAL
jgi:uncharacterized protein with PQ loop repeat